MSSNRPPEKIAGGKFEMEKRLGAGCFGEVWRGIDTSTKMQVAVKFESTGVHAPQLETEAEILKTCSKPTQPQGFVECMWFAREGRFNCMVMELLGKSLEDMVQKCSGKFSVPTVVLCAEQVLFRIEYLHSKGIIHRDIKPENFMFGIKDKVHHIYLIDFGLSKKYWDQRHINMRSKLSMTGTARYASINAHQGTEQSRRDDLEAIGHMFLYFLRGALPWSGLEAKTQEEKYRKIKEKKIDTPLDDLCKGFPVEFKDYLRTVRSLEFKERPDYNLYRQWFRNLRSKEHPTLQDHEFSWNLNNQELAKTLTPLWAVKPLRQPDDQARGQNAAGGGGVLSQIMSFLKCKSSARD